MPLNISNISGTGGLRLVNGGGVGDLSIQNIPYVPPPTPAPIPAPPALVTTNLVLHLDAGNTTSYPGTGTTWTDLSGNSNNGTLVNVTYNTRYNGHLIFDGVTDVVTVADSATVSQTNSLTLSMWIYADGIINACAVIHKGDRTSIDYDYMLYVTSNSTAIVGYKKNAAGIVASIGGYSVPGGLLGKWTQIGLTIDGTASNLWVDGLSVASTTFANAGIRDTTNLFNIGFGFQQAFLGYIGNVLMYSSALTDVQMLQNYNATKTRFGL